MQEEAGLIQVYLNKSTGHSPLKLWQGRPRDWIASKQRIEVAQSRVRQEKNYIFRYFVLRKWVYVRDEPRRV